MNTMTITEVLPDLSGSIFKLRRDAIYMKTEKGIAFRSRRKVFALNGDTIYRTFLQLLPYLDGRTECDSLLGGVPEKSRPMLTQLLHILQDSGIIDTVDQEDARSISPALAKAFAAQIDFIAHFGDRPNERFLAFRNSRILLCGSGAGLASAATALLRNGVRRLAVAAAPEQDLGLLHAEVARLEAADVQSEVAVGEADPAGFDLLIYCAEQPDLAALQRLNGLALAAGCPFLPAFVHAGNSMIGPIAAAGTPGCWQCTMLRWADNAPAREASTSWQAMAGVHAAQGAPVSQVPAQILGNNVAMEAFKYFVGQPAPEAGTRLLVQDVATLGSSLVAVLPHPDCPACAAAGDAGAPDVALNDASAVVQAWTPYIDARFGKFRGFSDESLEQLPLRLTQLRPAAAVAERLGDAEFVVAGWSLSNSDAARVHALSEALALSAHDAAPLHLHASIGAAAAGETSVEAQAVAGWLGNGDAPRARHLAARRIGDGKQAWLPAGALHPYFDNEGRFDPHGAGLGVGADLDSATAQALISLGTHLSIAGLARGSLSLSSLRGWQQRCGKDADYLHRAAAQLDFTDLEIGVTQPCAGLVSALLRPVHDGAQQVDAMLVGTGFNQAQAVTNLLAQLVARAQLERHGQSLRLPRRAGLFAGATIRPAWSGETDFDGIADTSGTGGTSGTPALAEVAQAAAAAGWDIWWKDVSAPDVALTRSLRVVKVVLARALGGAR